MVVILVTSFLLGWTIFRCYVSFREGVYVFLKKQPFITVKRWTPSSHIFTCPISRKRSCATSWRPCLATKRTSLDMCCCYWFTSAIHNQPPVPWTQQKDFWSCHGLRKRRIRAIQPYASVKNQAGKPRAPETLVSRKNLAEGVPQT